ncbi:hypothetical protein H0H81_008084 [Sphagnurus paluster]|uniref:Uncharacterized protein n=1 Tax=Sphagnurus paluster TaxID=117069 RepID=A0A9P7FSV9_9AGAR|nr:hypothetical protein H0H81_008084 [Sphagnurus paluster]
MTQLKDGKYYIINRASGARVGVSPLDPGFNRWAVGKAPHHLEEHELPAITWVLTHKQGDLYHLQVEGGSAIGENGAVYAPPKGEQLWQILYREGNKAYTIEKEEKPVPLGWVLRGEDTQVKLAPLPSTKSIPPQFFSTDIWEFKHIGK